MQRQRGPWNGIAHTLANRYRKEGLRGTVYFRQLQGNWSPTGTREGERTYLWDCYGFRVNDSVTTDLEPVGAQYIYRGRGVWRRVERVAEWTEEPADMGEFPALLKTLVETVQLGDYRFFARLNVELETTVFSDDTEETYTQWLHLTATLKLNQLLKVASNRWQDLLELAETKVGKISDLSQYDGIRAIEVRLSHRSFDASF